MIDIDHFKQFNDRFGHVTGDEVLATCARQMAASLRESDEIGRYGGEEFSVLLPETSMADGAIVAEKLRRAVDELRIDSPDGAVEPVSVNVSIGVASIPQPDISDEQSLVNRADQALYDAKHAGRNRVSLAKDAAVTLVERLAN